MPYKNQTLARTHVCWRAMRHRSGRKRGYEHVKVCKRWRTFKNFLADMGLKPTNSVLDRKKNHLGYSPSNCRWVTFKQSTANRKCTVLVGGKRVLELARELKIPAGRIYNRVLRGWSVDEIRANPNPVHHGGFQKQFVKHYNRNK